MTAVLPDAEWRQHPGLRRVVVALAGDFDGPRIVGGAVRDSLLGLTVSDVDLATPLLPQVVIDRLEAARIKAVPTGLDHGTITAVADGNHYEITTLRRDVTTDGRRATVAFASDWREDAARRDFTINALYADPASGEIFDYFGGLSDLDAGIVRFIGDANQRIAEDYLRIMRFFRFFCRYGKSPVNGDAIEACRNGAHGLTSLSRERIAQELLKLMALADPVAAVALMVDNGIFAPFLPELSPSAVDNLAHLTDRERTHEMPISLPARLLTLLCKDTVAVDNVAARLKLSNKLREALTSRVGEAQPQPDTMRTLAYRKGIECARDVALLYASDANLSVCLAQIDDWVVPAFTVKGGNLITLGLNPGPTVARTLHMIEAQWTAENFPGNNRLDQIVTETVAAARSASRNAKAASAVSGRAK